MHKRWILLMLAACLFAVPTQAYEVRLTTVNDLFTWNEIDDDLYTFSFAFEFNRRSKRFRFFENAFTDQENGLRFDETYLSIGSALPRMGEWSPELEVGAVYVGEGLLGQSAQNTIHRAIGNREVFLDYLGDERIHGTLRLAAARGWTLGTRHSVQAHAELFTAPEFKSYMAAGVRVFVQPHRNLRVNLGLGARATETDFEPLERWIDGFGLTYELGFRLFEHLEIAWDYNAFGTEMQHVNLSYVWTPRAPKADF